MRQSTDLMRAMRYVLTTGQAVAPALKCAGAYDALARDYLVDALAHLVMWAKDTRENSRRAAHGHAASACALVRAASTVSPELVTIGHMARAVLAMTDATPADAMRHAAAARPPMVSMSFTAKEDNSATV